MSAIVTPGDPFDPPCAIEGLPAEDYFALPAVSRSQLYATLTKSPAHARVPSKESAAMSLGTVAHALIMEPDTVVHVKPAVDGRTKAGKEALADFEAQVADLPGLVVTAEQHESACRMRDAVMAHPLAGAIYDSGRAEVTMLARDPESGVLVKIRLDWLPDGHAVLVDLKTASEVWPEAVEAHASRYGYHFQAAVYRHVYRLVTEQDAPWLNVYVESQPPYSVMVVPMAQEAIDRGTQAMRHALRIWALCEEHDLWPGPGWDWITMQYGLVSLGVKKWAL